VKSPFKFVAVVSNVLIISLVGNGFYTSLFGAAAAITPAQAKAFLLDPQTPIRMDAALEKQGIVLLDRNAKQTSVLGLAKSRGADFFLVNPKQSGAQLAVHFVSQVSRKADQIDITISTHDYLAGNRQVDVRSYTLRAGESLQTSQPKLERALAGLEASFARYVRETYASTTKSTLRSLFDLLVPSSLAADKKSPVVSSAMIGFVVAAVVLAGLGVGAKKLGNIAYDRAMSPGGGKDAFGAGMVIFLGYAMIGLAVVCGGIAFIIFVYRLGKSR
jgi:hypothetical protein